MTPLCHASSGVLEMVKESRPYPEVGGTGAVSPLVHFFKYIVRFLTLTLAKEEA